MTTSPDTLSGRPLFAAPELELLERRPFTAREYDDWRRSEHSPPWLGNPVLWVENLLGLGPAHLAIDKLEFAAPIPTPEWPNNCRLHVWHFKPEKPNGRTLLLIPKKGGGYGFARMLCARFSRQGYDVWTLLPPLHTLRLPEGTKTFNVFAHDMPIVIRHFNQAITELRGLVRFIREQGAPRIGVFGISLGAVYGSLLLPHEPESIAATVLTLGGADIARIFSASEMESVRHQHTEEEYRRLLAPVEPLRYVHSGLSDKVLMINGTKDTAIPPYCADRLHEGLGHPTRINLEAGHVTALLHLRRILRATDEHFNRLLG